MEEQDFERLEKIMEQRDRKLREEIGGDMDRKVGVLREEIGGMDRRIGTLRQELNEDFKHHVGILTEDFNHKLQIVAEGHQMLAEKIDRVKTDIEHKIDVVEKKVDLAAADITLHRTDTEGHKKGYLVREE